jgi:hypothetical protein
MQAKIVWFDKTEERGALKLVNGESIHFSLADVVDSTAHFYPGKPMIVNVEYGPKSPIIKVESDFDDTQECDHVFVGKECHCGIEWEEEGLC